jgi:hypothetical protein
MKIVQRSPFEKSFLLSPFQKPLRVKGEKNVMLGIGGNVIKIGLPDYFLSLTQLTHSCVFPELSDPGN